MLRHGLQIKNGPHGHAAYELMRQVLAGQSTELKGAFDEEWMGKAIRGGRAHSLDFTASSWPADGVAAAGLLSALKEPGCRVRAINLGASSGDGLGDLVVGLAGMLTGTPISNLK